MTTEATSTIPVIQEQAYAPKAFMSAEAPPKELNAENTESQKPMRVRGG